MKRIQITIDELLLERVDATVQTRNTTHSAFIREALVRALAHYHVRRLEERDAAGYARIPADAEEVAEGEAEQAWGGAWNAAN